jgi:hypothetical protein
VRRGEFRRATGVVLEFSVSDRWGWCEIGVKVSSGCDRSALAEYQVEDPATAGVRAGTTAMGQNLTICATGFFQSVGQDGKIAEEVVIVSGLGNGSRRRGCPLTRRERLEGVSRDVVEKREYIQLFLICQIPHDVARRLIRAARCYAPYHIAGPPRQGGAVPITSPGFNGNPPGLNLDCVRDAPLHCQIGQKLTDHHRPAARVVCEYVPEVSAARAGE